MGPWDRNGMRNPSGVAVDGDGAAYVVDRGNHRVQRFSAAGEFLGSWGGVGTGAGQFVGPAGIALSPGGDAYVVDAGNDRVQCV